ncbi:MAG: hypothetical protein JWM88_828 [Verrucomicrobia bacterium]|nr:hypothetical protein [Verrucomicrobiota bacterium]
MHSTRRFLLGLVAVALSAPLVGQITVSSTPRKVSTAIVLGENPQIISEFPSPSAREPVNVSIGTSVSMSIPYAPALIRQIKWTKDSQAVSTSPTFEIPDAKASDGGFYNAFVTLVDGANPWMDAVQLRVGTQRGAAMLNISTRATISAGQPFFITGFVIETASGTKREGKTVLIRAIGPTLGLFGVPSPLADPKLEVFRADGSQVDLAATSILSNYVALAQRLAGAFLTNVGAHDLTYLLTLPAGAYSVKISSASGQTGTVLLEVYEVPVPF